MTSIIVSTPGVCGGRPRIEGTRIDVVFLKGEFDHGKTVAELAKEFDFLSVEQLQAAKDYIADHSEEIDKVIESDEKWLAGFSQATIAGLEAGSEV